MNWVLILITLSNAVAHVPFDTQAACEIAKTKMESYHSVKITECFKK